MSNFRSSGLFLLCVPIFLFSFMFCQSKNRKEESQIQGIPKSSPITLIDSEVRTKRFDSLGFLKSDLDNKEPEFIEQKKDRYRSETATELGYLDAGIKLSSHYLIDELPEGFVKDGTIDYTAYIQKALDRYDNLVFPAFKLLVNDKGLKITSNKVITFLKGSELLLKPSFNKGYSILDITRASNITLYNPVITGDRYTHLGTAGEWGMGISIKGSNNINIFGAKITNCWGDGIYIGQVGGNNTSKNIRIKDAYLRKNRRDGISIISVDGLILENVYAGYHDGTKPMCGINFETNNPQCEIKNVRVLNAITEYNQGSGIQVQLSTLLGGQEKRSDIAIINHSDVGSKSFATKIACNRKQGIFGGSVAGIITIEQPVWSSTVSRRPLSFTTDQKNIKVKILSPRIKNWQGIALDHEQTHAIFNKYSNGDIEVLTR